MTRECYTAAEKPEKRWRPPLALQKICDRDINLARQRREALRRALSLRASCSIAERISLALPDFRRVFGRETKRRQLYNIITLVLERDGGRRDFERLEIFLPITPQRRTGRRVQDLRSETMFEELADDFATIVDRDNPTVAERSFCWRKIVAAYCAKRGAGKTEDRGLKRDLRDFVLAEVPALAQNAAALKRTFERNLNRAKHGIDQIVDRRAAKSGRRRDLRKFQDDLLMLARHSGNGTRDRIAQGYRELYDGTAPTGERFSEDFRTHFSFDVRRAKSDVPRAVRAAVRPILKGTAADRRGPKTGRLGGPSLRRTYEDFFAGDSYSADDVTFNQLFVEWDEGGEYVFDGKRFNLTRGQTLLFCDERSLRVLGYYITPRPNYSASTICAGINRICMDERVGLPFKRFLFERGIWKARAVKSAVDWARIDEAFVGESIQLLPTIAHATTPKGKLIERIIGAVQNQMDGLPGYVGRNQRLDGPEKVTWAQANLRKTGQRSKEDVDPRLFFLTKEQFECGLHDATRRYNDEPQNGKILDGLSPEEGWLKFHSKRAHIVLPESLRYLLSTEVAETRVTREGIVIKRRGQPDRCYCGNERLGELIGEKVRVRFDPERPELIAVCHLSSDPKERQPFSVEIDPNIPAINADESEFAAAKAATRKFRKFGRDMHRVLTPRFRRTVLYENFGSEDSRRTGEALLSANREQAALDAARQREGQRAEQIARRHGVSISAGKLKRPEKALRLARAMDAAETRILAKEAQSE